MLLDLLEGMVWLVVAVAALFLLAAALGGPATQRRNTHLVATPPR